MPRLSDRCDCGHTNQWHIGAMLDSKVCQIKSCGCLTFRPFAEPGDPPVPAGEECRRCGGHAGYCPCGDEAPKAPECRCCGHDYGSHHHRDGETCLKCDCGSWTSDTGWCDNCQSDTCERQREMDDHWTQVQLNQPCRCGHNRHWHWDADGTTRAASPCGKDERAGGSCDCEGFQEPGSSAVSPDILSGEKTINDLRREAQEAADAAEEAAIAAEHVPRPMQAVAYGIGNQLYELMTHPDAIVRVDNGVLAIQHADGTPTIVQVRTVRVQ